MVDTGDLAPDFVLHDQDRNEVRLSDFRGKKKVVLVFYPFSFSGICQSELCEIRDGIRDYSNDRVQTLAISCDSVQVQKAWADAEGLQFQVLSDFWPHGDVAKAYGVFHEGAGAALRGTFVVDTDGVVVHKVVNELGQRRDHAAVLAALS